MAKSKITNFTLPTEFANILRDISDEIGYSQSQIVRWLLPTALAKFVDDRKVDPGGTIFRAKHAEIQTTAWMLSHLSGLPTPTATQAPTASPTPPPVKVQAKTEPEVKFAVHPWPDIEVIKRGPVVWFTLEPLCAAYKVSPDALRRQIDVEDELEYMDKNWIDQVSITQLKSLCLDRELESKVSAWVVHMQDTTK